MKRLRFRKEYDGAQDYDIILRCIAQAKDKDAVVHIPRILYHWRCHEQSTASNTDSKMYAYENGLKAVEDFARSRGYDVRVSHMRHLGFYRVEYLPDIFTNRPEVGILAGPVVVHGKIAGGAMNKEGKVLYGGLPTGYSGYQHRASLCMTVSAGDVRNMKVCPALQPLWESMVVLNKGKREADYVKMSLAFCERARAMGYKVVYDPQFRVGKQ